MPNTVDDEKMCSWPSDPNGGGWQRCTSWDLRPDKLRPVGPKKVYTFLVLIARIRSDSPEQCCPRSANLQIELELQVICLEINSLLDPRTLVCAGVMSHWVV